MLNRFKTVGVIAVIHFSLLIVLTFPGLKTIAQENSLTIISNIKGAPSEMKMNQLRSVLKGEKEWWNDGTKIVIALMKSNTPVGNITSRKVYNMSSDELNKFWLALVFQGKARPPSFFNSLNELQQFIAQTPGAIGVISGQISVREVKTVIVEGKKTI
jgi:hypothetical protein